MDAFLLNVRKINDVYKLQVGVLDRLGMRQSSLATQEFEEEEGGVLTTKKQVKQAMNSLLNAVLKFFYRMSKSIENERDYFPLNVY